MLYRDTTPAPRWGPTPVYGPCEERSCEGTARTTCDTCGGEFCLTHADHNEHVRPEPPS